MFKNRDESEVTADKKKIKNGINSIEIFLKIIKSILSRKSFSHKNYTALSLMSGNRWHPFFRLEKRELKKLVNSLNSHILSRIQLTDKIYTI